MIQIYIYMHALCFFHNKYVWIIVAWQYIYIYSTFFETSQIISSLTLSHLGPRIATHIACWSLVAALANTWSSCQQHTFIAHTRQVWCLDAYSCWGKCRLDAAADDVDVDVDAADDQHPPLKNYHDWLENPLWMKMYFPGSHLSFRGVCKQKFGTIISLLPGQWRLLACRALNGLLPHCRKVPQAVFGVVFKHLSASKMGDAGDAPPQKFATWNLKMKVWFRWFSFSFGSFSGSMVLFLGVIPSQKNKIVGPRGQSYV